MLRVPAFAGSSSATLICQMSTHPHARMLCAQGPSEVPLPGGSSASLVCIVNNAHAQMAHRGPVTSIEWCPFESSMLSTTSSDGQLALWDLALERDPEEEAALAAHMNAASPDDLPPQLLFVHLQQVRAHAPRSPSSRLADLFGGLPQATMVTRVNGRPAQGVDTGTHKLTSKR